MMNIGQALLQADRNLFYIINKKLSFTGLDTIMLLLRQPATWIPLYLFFLLFFYYNCRKYLLPVIVLSLLTFAFSDFTSAALLKPFIGRLRPCHDPALSFEINNLAGCGGIFGMPSSHAANHFGLATFWFLVVKQTTGQKWYWLWIWAFIICYAQVYVGVHFPGDVLAGGLLGTLIALYTFSLFERWTNNIDTSLKTNF